MDLITAGALSSLVLEGIKLLVRYFKKDVKFEFPIQFYVIMLPLLNAIAPFALFGLGITVLDPILGMTVVDVVRYLVLILLGSLISLTTNTVALSPLKAYAYCMKTQE